MRLTVILELKQKKNRFEQRRRDDHIDMKKYSQSRLQVHFKTCNFSGVVSKVTLAHGVHIHKLSRNYFFSNKDNNDLRRTVTNNSATTSNENSKADASTK